MNLINRIAAAMDNDDENLDKQSGLLAAAYQNANFDGKELLDRAFIALCGYSLETLLSEQSDD